MLLWFCCSFAALCMLPMHSLLHLFPPPLLTFNFLLFLFSLSHLLSPPSVSRQCSSDISSLQTWRLCCFFPFQFWVTEYLFLSGRNWVWVGRMWQHRNGDHLCASRVTFSPFFSFTCSLKDVLTPTCRPNETSENLIKCSKTFLMCTYHCCF